MSRLSDELRKSLEAATQDYQAEIATVPAVLDYLLGRGIDRGAVQRYRLGVVSGRLIEHRDYAGMICIPYLTRLGGVTALKFRQPYEMGQDDPSPKYLVPPGQQPRIFNGLAFDQADKLGYIAICEGETDAMVLEHYCGIPAVGVPGVDTWIAHPEWKELFRGYDRVLIFQDDDEVNPKTGQRPGEELALRIRSDVDQGSMISLEYKDVNAAFLAAGPDYIRERAGVSE